MDEQTVDLIKVYADKLGVAVEVLWEAMLRQAPVAAATNIVICLVCGLIAGWLIRKLRQSEWFDKFDKEDTVIRWVCIFVLGCVAFGIMLGNLQPIMTALYNPAFWALRILTGGW